MIWLAVLGSARALTSQEAVDAALARAPSLAVSQARVDEAEARLMEAHGHLLPTASLTGGVVEQSKVELDLLANFPKEILPLIDESQVQPISVVPGFQWQGGGQLIQPLIAPQAWAAGTTARAAADLSRVEAEGDRARVVKATLEAWHAAWEAQALSEDAQRGEELATRLVEKGEQLVSLGAIASADILPFRRALATAHAEVATAAEGVRTARGILAVLTGTDEAPTEPQMPAEAPVLDELLAKLDRPDLRAAAQRVSVAEDKARMERSAAYPTLGAGAGFQVVTPAPDIGKELTWRVGLQANVPLFQGRIVTSKIDQAKAQAAQADAGTQAIRELAEIEVRTAHGVLARALVEVKAEEQVVDFAQQAVAAAESRMGEGGGTLLQLQQSQLELIAAEAKLTRAKAEAAKASDLLSLAVRGQ